MHAKAWCLDGVITSLGSPNLTHNGLENNEELLGLVRDEETALRFSRNFERLWKESQDVTEDMINEALRNAAVARETRRRSRSASQSRPRSASEPRSQHGATLRELCDGE